jgi:molecular chaperone HscC
MHIAGYTRAFSAFPDQPEIVRAVMIIGIDLGTTNSVAAYMTADGPRLIPNALGDVLTPSVVGIDAEGKLLVGRTAKELQVVEPERCAALFKRYMGSDWSIELGGRKFTPEELSAAVLRTLKEDAEAHLGVPLSQAVVTVPAYFNEHQRKATLTAGRIAGWDVKRILNEPTAAAIAYGMHQTDQDRLLAVVDLGGGTFDVSIVEQFEGTLEVRASSGESFLGGEDFTRTLVARVLESQGLMFERAELDAPRMVSRLIQQCEVAKCQLSGQETATVRVPTKAGEFRDDSPKITITRHQVETWCAHILARIELPIRRALGDARLNRADISEVILVGGATRMPMFIQHVTELFGLQPRCRLNPDEVVALGAAVQAGLIDKDRGVGDLVVTDVSPFTLGMSISKRLGLERRDGYFLPIINRNTTIPVSRVQRVQTTEPNQTRLAIQVYQGENRRVENNILLGEFELTNIPSGPAGQQVDVRFTYDLNGVLEVEATIVETKHKANHLITRHARGLDEKQIAAAVAAMQALKTHPREETVNRFLLRRAERVYQELPLLERQLLAEMLDGFEVALDIGQAEVIGRHQKALEEFLARYDRGEDENSLGNDDDL